MPELHLQRTDATLKVTFGEHSDAIPFADVAVNAQTWRHIYDDAITYGKELFKKTFHQENMRDLLTTMPANERLVVVADDPLVAVIPWEYLRDQNNKLLASRLNFVRGISEAKRQN